MNSLPNRAADANRSVGAHLEIVVTEEADLVLAIAIAERLGDKVVLITASTGGTLAALATTHPQLAVRIDATVFISPNFKLNNPTAPILTAPFAETLMPIIIRAERGVEPRNALHAGSWKIGRAACRERG